MKKNNIHLSLLLSIMLAIAPTSAPAMDNAGFRHTVFLQDKENILPHTQVWGICTGGKDNTELFLATNDGLFRYDGIRMESLREECGTIIRAVRYDGTSGRLYSAGVNSFGWWETDRFGDMKYHQLFKNPDFRSCSYDFWRIGIIAEGNRTKVYFQCRKKIAVYDSEDGSLSEIFPKKDFRYLHQDGEKLFVQDGDMLCSLSGAEMKAITEIRGRIISLVQDGTIAAVENMGLLRIGEDGRTAELDSESNRILRSAKITDCSEYEDSQLLIGTTLHGLFITDLDGHIDTSLRINSLLDNSTVLCTAADHAGNIWAGLDSGAAMIDNSSADYYMSDSRFGQIHEILETRDNRFLIGSNKGLFLIDKEMNIKHIGRQPGSVWDIREFDGKIFIAHDKGLFLLTESLELQPLYTDTGVFCVHKMHKGSRDFMLGTYSGLATIRIPEKDSEKPECKNILNYKGFTRYMAVDAFDRIWVTVPQTGFVRLKVDIESKTVSDEKPYDIASGTEKNVFSTKIDGKLFLCAGSRAYEVDNPEGEPQESRGAENIMEAAGGAITSLTQGGNRFWYISSSGYGYVEREETGLVRHHGILKYANSERVTHVSPTREGCAIGYRNGIGFCNGETSTENTIRISRAVAQGAGKELRHDLSETVFTVPASNNTICIYVSSSLPGNNEIQYRMRSESDEWKTVYVEDCIQLPSLAFGRHRVEIRSASNYGTVCTLDLKILPPWYISWQMCLVYLALLCAMALCIRSYYLKKNRKIKEEEIKRLEYENLVKEKRISEIEKEKLRNELKYKGQELATITLNNSRRNNLINELISKLQTVSSAGDTEEIKKNASSLIKELESQLKDESDWKKSEEYFNTIYDGLLDRLRATYPTLSKTDLKLCVYIKLNMSTKEIADLMNISPRSVEMARYRLRKKLGLNPDEEISSVLK